MGSTLPILPSIPHWLPEDAGGWPLRCRRVSSQVACSPSPMQLQARLGPGQGKKRWRERLSLGPVVGLEPSRSGDLSGPDYPLAHPRPRAQGLRRAPTGPAQAPLTPFQEPSDLPETQAGVWPGWRRPGGSAHSPGLPQSLSQQGSSQEESEWKVPKPPPQVACSRVCVGAQLCGSQGGLSQPAQPCMHTQVAGACSCSAPGLGRQWAGDRERDQQTPSSLGTEGCLVLLGWGASGGSKPPEQVAK
ncbi:hypothetical protein VULLAG_LOCUS949 [Vulpes lagopus]